MEDWDQEQLEAVVANKHGNERPVNATEIICKFFLDAVERRMYGWCAPPRGIRTPPPPPPFSSWMPRKGGFAAGRSFL